MSTQIISVIVILLAALLPKIGITLGNDDLTTTIQTICTIIPAIWIWYQRTKLQKAPAGLGDVNFAGVRKSNLL